MNAVYNIELSMHGVLQARLENPTAILIFRLILGAFKSYTSMLFNALFQWGSAYTSGTKPHIPCLVATKM